MALFTMSLMARSLPQKAQLPAVSLLGNLFVLWFAPYAFAAMSISACLVYLISHAKSQKGHWVLFGVVYCISQFFLLRFLQEHSVDLGLGGSFSVLGVAYFTCRDVHYLVESYKGNVRKNIVTFWYYQSFLPVMIAGPINRYHEFEREIQRRSLDFDQISKGIERIIYGYAKVTVLGNYLIEHKIQSYLTQLPNQESILHSWLVSLADWAYLYAQFSGWSDVAIGFSLCIGIKISENFNRPLSSKSLVDFWKRWHISLSSWCKDYVFTPTLLITRNLFIAISLSMIAMGLWHESSLYYIFWGIYHAIGITLCRLYMKQENDVVVYFRTQFWWSSFTRALTIFYLINASVFIGLFYDGLY